MKNGKIYILFLFFVILIFLGNINLSSAVQNTKFQRLEGSQIIWSIAGVLTALLVPFLMKRIPLSIFIPLAYTVSLTALAAVLIWGEKISGSRRWFETPFGSLQPSEFSKPVIVLFISYYLEKINRGNFYILIVFFFSLTAAGLILIEPDLGTASVIIVLLLTLYYLNEKKLKRFFLGVSLLILILIFSFIVSAKPYQLQRLTGFFSPEKNPESYYQTRQSVTIIGSGGLYGKGYKLGEGNLRGFIPADHTDFVLGVFGEEFGLFGFMAFMGLWLGIFLIILKIACETKGFYRNISIGVFTILFFQSTYNLAMVTGLVPVTGIPSPFMTYGGSSMVSNSVMIGLVIFTSHKREKKEDLWNRLKRKR